MNEIDWSALPNLGSVGALGALVFVALRGYQLYGKLPDAKFYAMLRSPLAWMMLIVGVAASGVFTWAMFADVPESGVFKLFITGAGAPALMTQAVGAVAANTPPVAGRNDTAPDRFHTSDLFV